MTRDLTKTLARWLAAGDACIGQIAIRPRGEAYQLCHRDDLGTPELRESADPLEARALAQYDEAGAFRPLKTAPNLRRGWRLLLPDAAAVRLALDAFYPAMLGVLLDFREGRLPPVPLRDTLGRQTGMYAVTRRLTDPQAQALIAGFCRTDGGCLKRILWPIAPGLPICSLPREKFDPGAQEPGELPLLCHEACNLLVAKAREVVKGAPPA